MLIEFSFRDALNTMQVKASGKVRACAKKRTIAEVLCSNGGNSWAFSSPSVVHSTFKN